ncbi:MAG: hypothetical protein OXI87_17035 [Albidovulum sp.]|nr:hypothetical protein [Albidovulum sp.]MDE0530558.1 hypothetical protein [Albidovulum sp.]
MHRAVRGKRALKVAEQVRDGSVPAVQPEGEVDFAAVAEHRPEPGRCASSLARTGVLSVATALLSRTDRNWASRIATSKDADPGIQLTGL